MIRVKKDQKRSSLDGISQFSEDLENEWVPMSRNQKSRKPINPTSKTNFFQGKCIIAHREFDKKSGHFQSRTKSGTKKIKQRFVRNIFCAFFRKKSLIPSGHFQSKTKIVNREIQLLGA